jgi:cephalosporin hydroxylase
MNENEKFELEVQANIDGLAGDKMLQNLSRIWLRDSALHKWSYNFRWMGRPAIQLPTDAWAMQELIWEIKPDLIIEAGIAHGGSLVYYASLLALLDMDDLIKSGSFFDPNATKRKVLGLDIDIRSHNRDCIDAHSMRPWIEMIEGSSISAEVITKVHEYSKSYKRILVTLDSNHTHDEASHHCSHSRHKHHSVVDVFEFFVIIFFVFYVL